MPSGPFAMGSRLEILPGRASRSTYAATLWLCLALLTRTHAADLAEYRRADLGLPPVPVVSDAGFENGGERWRVREGFRVDPTGGRNGTAGLPVEAGSGSGPWARSAISVSMRSNSSKR